MGQDSPPGEGGVMFPYRFEWDEQLRAEAKVVRRRDTFGGFVWPEAARPVAQLVPKRRHVKQPKMTGDEVVAEVEWLLDNGANRWEVSAQLGRSLSALEKLCQRKKRNDLARQVAMPWSERNAA